MNHNSFISSKEQNIAGSDASEERGPWLERLIFQNRPLILLGCLFITIGFGFALPHLQLTASFESMIPARHPFIQNYDSNKGNLGDLSGNTVDIIVRADHGTILNRDYVTALRDINDEVFLLPGVNRPFMRSLWTPNVRWLAVTDTGLNGGTVMPYDVFSAANGFEELGDDIQRAGLIGSLVSPDFKSSMLEVPLLDTDANTGRPLDYGALTRRLDDIKTKYAARGVTIGITGFAVIVGDLLQGMRQIFSFFAGSILIAAAMVFWYTRCVRSTMLVVFCSLLAVFWQLGSLPLIGFRLDPYSVLVPFLVFAIGMSHGAQKMNGVMQDIGRGRTNLGAARMTFRRLFVAGFTALCCDAVGFAVLYTIKIPAIQNLAIVASIGVAILVITNLILLPVFLSYIGVSSASAAKSLMAETAADLGAEKPLLWTFLDLFTQRRYAAGALITAVILGLAGAFVARNLQIGDIQPGAPELRPNSVYNLDNKYLVDHYATTSDVFVVMVNTPFETCADYATLVAMSRLEARLGNLPGVIRTSSFVDFQRMMSVELNEGSMSWYDLVPNQASLNQAVNEAPPSLLNPECSFMPISVFLQDHKAATLDRVVAESENFIASQHLPGVSFKLAAGNAGIAAATNIVVSRASWQMLLEVYAAVIALSLLTFRSWRAVLTAVLPLILTSILAEALMVELGIGVKVATLPVTALGVGIGVDYALYILSVTLSNMRQGMALSEAYYRALLFTGKVVMLTGFTLAAAVGTWAFSPIKFQADMGILLAFMFLWNMLGALILLPALASFLFPQNRTPA